MVIDILTIFPEVFTPLEVSIVKRAREKGLIEINIYNLRDFTPNKHKKVDDLAYGGGIGMVMKPEPIFEGIEYLRVKSDEVVARHEVPWQSHEVRGCHAHARNDIKIQNSKIILLSPQGSLFTQKMAKELSCEKHLIFICGHYEGIDERVRTIVDKEISIGEYILTGGELAAMVVADSIVRLIPGVLPEEATEEDSFSKGDLLDWPHYTRPRVFRGLKVPEVLLSGNHRKVTDWRQKQAKERTRLRQNL